MPINPSISLGVQPARFADPLDTFAKAQGIRNLLRQGPLQDAQLERLTLDNEQTRLENAALPAKMEIAKTTAEGVRKTGDLERQIKEFDLNRKKADDYASLASSVTDDQSKDIAIGQAHRRGLLDAEGAARMLARPYDEKMKAELAQIAKSALTAKEQIEIERNKVLDQYKADEETRKKALAPYELDKAKLEASGAVKPTGDYAEFKALNPQPFPDKKVEADAYFKFLKEKKSRVPTPGVDVPFPKDVEAQRNRMRSSQAERNGLSPGQDQRIQRLATDFDRKPEVKNFQESTNKYQTVKGILDLPGIGGPGDLAVVFEFMKGLDPTSVVRESEFATAAKSGNIFSGIFAKFNGYLKPEGGFLPPQVKTDFLRILNQKLNVSKRQVKGVYEDYARRINKISGQKDGLEYLTDYTKILDDEEAPAKDMSGLSTQELLDIAAGKK